MLNPVDALDDGFEWLGDQFHRVAGRKTGGGNHQVNHGHAYLRLFLTRDRQNRQQPDKDGGKQHQRGQR